MNRHIWTRLFVGLLLALSVTVIPDDRPAQAQQAQPSLRLIGIPGYRLGVSGQGWPHRGRLSVVARSGTQAVGVQFRATRAGTFSLGVNSVDVCSGVGFDVYTRSGRHVHLASRPLACPAVLETPVPTVTVLQGSTLPSADVKMGTLQALDNPFVLRVGQILYFWEPGTQHPAFLPQTNPAYLMLVEQGTTAARACAQPDCAAGFYWRWRAVQPGNTGIDLSPACRQTKPQCEIPDRLVEVTILP
jgi:hypothetical protein